MNVNAKSDSSVALFPGRKETTQYQLLAHVHPFLPYFSKNRIVHIHSLSHNCMEKIFSIVEIKQWLLSVIHELVGIAARKFLFTATSFHLCGIEGNFN